MRRIGDLGACVAAGEVAPLSVSCLDVRPGDEYTSVAAQSALPPIPAVQ